MEKYLCVLKKVSTYLNIHPEFIFKEGKLEVADKADFPTRGNIYAYNAKYHDEYDFNDNIAIISFDLNELEDYKDASGSFYPTEKKINFNPLTLGRIKTNINEEKIYKLIEFKSLNNTVELEKLDIIELEEEFANKYKLEPNELIYINDDDYIYGLYRYENNGYRKFLIPEKDYELEKRGKNSIVIRKNELPYPVIYLKENEQSEERIDVISEKILFNKYINFIETDIGKKEIYSAKEIIESLEKMYKSGCLSVSRAEKLKTKIESYKLHDQTNDEIIKILKPLILNDKSEEISESIASKIIEDQNLARKLQNVKSVLDEIEKLNKIKNELIQDIEKTQEEFKKLKEQKENINYDELKEKEHIQLDSEIMEKRNELIDIEEKIKNKLEKLQLVDDIKDLHDENIYQERNRKKLEKDNEKLEEVKKKKQADLEKLENDISEAINKVFEEGMDKYPKIAFDGIIASKMLEAAAEYEKTNFKQDYEKAVEILNNVSKGLFFKVCKRKIIV